MSALFCKKSAFFCKNDTFTQSNSVKAVLEIFSFRDFLEIFFWRHNLPTWPHRQFFFDVVLFLLSKLGTGLSYMSISTLVLELWQFTFIRDWPEIQKLEIPPSKFCLLSGDWGKLARQNLVWLFLMKCY